MDAPWQTFNDGKSAVRAAEWIANAVAYACNTLGCSEFSASDSTDVPSAPSSLDVRVAGEDALSVRIGHPDDDGGANVTHFSLHVWSELVVIKCEIGYWGPSHGYAATCLRVETDSSILAYCFHPGYSSGPDGAANVVDVNQKRFVFPNQDMGWVPSASEFHPSAGSIKGE